MRWIERLAFVGIIGVFIGVLAGAVTADVEPWVRIVWGCGTIAAAAAVVLALHHLGRER